MEKSTLELRGFRIFKGYLNANAQAEILASVRSVAAQVPPFSPMTPYGRPMSVKLTSAGKYGWVSDQSGYRYERHHPNGTVWPDIPVPVLEIWRELVGTGRLPDCCLINFYGEGARMGLHQDRDEVDFNWPVVSISLGDDGLFRVGHPIKGGSTETIWLQSGDVVVMGGDARLTYHGVDRIRFGSSQLLANGGRLNLTLRVVD